MLLKQHKRSSIILTSCLALALVSGAIFISFNGSTFADNSAGISDKKSTDKDKVNQDMSEKDKQNDTDKELEKAPSSENEKKNGYIQENKDKNIESNIVNKTETEKESSPTYDDSKKEESKPTTPSPTPAPSKPEQQKPEPTPAPKPVCAIGENPNLPCDYIDLPAGYQVMDYETAKVKMVEADANGGGYDHGWLSRNDGQSVFIIRFW